jgi:hypothetical protein
MERGYVARQLYSNARNEFTCMAYIATATGEEETGSKALLVKITPSDSARNRRFTSAG